MFLTEKLSAEIREMLAPDKEPGNQNPGRPWWDAARVLLDEVDRLKPLAQVGAAVQKLAEHDWHREAEGGPCLVVAYAMNEDFDYDNKPRLLGGGRHSGGVCVGRRRQRERRRGGPK